MTRLAGLRNERFKAGWDSTLLLDWKHADCSVGDWDRPTLFVLPPESAGNRRFWVLSGLFYARTDVVRARRHIASRFHVPCTLMTLSVTGAVLRNALPRRDPPAQLLGR